MDNLGGANFKLTADQSAFTKGLDDAEKRAQVSTRAISTSVGAMSGAVDASSRSMNRSVLQAAYAIDDLQYGFRSVVNNIPQLLMFLGPGIAGAAGIAAVAVSQLINHWEDLTTLFSGEEKKLPILKEGLEGLADSLHKISAEIKILKDAQEGDGGMFGPLTNAIFGGGAGGQDRLDKLKDLQKEGKEKLQAEKDVEDLEATDEQRAVASRVKAAIGKMSEGSNTLMDVLTASGMSPEDAKKAISDASRGKEYALDDILARTKGQKGAGFGELGRAGPAANAALAEQQQQAKWEAEGRKNDREMTKKLAKEEFDEKKRAAVQALEDQRSAMTERHHQEDLALQARKEQLGHPTQILSGAKAVSDYYQKAAGDAPLIALAKETKKIQEDQRKELQAINKTLEKERRVRPS